ncbi:MAG: hypothetical protein M1826_006268 [Phylliscum demangeonii]|nr:MAG: hypothetical protein M1826_006268 [Phylliscum demangeonii]
MLARSPSFNQFNPKEPGYGLSPLLPRVGHSPARTPPQVDQSSGNHRPGRNGRIVETHRELDLPGSMPVPIPMPHSRELDQSRSTMVPIPVVHPRAESQPRTDLPSPSSFCNPAPFPDPYVHPTPPYEPESGQMSPSLPHAFAPFPPFPAASTPVSLASQSGLFTPLGSQPPRRINVRDLAHLHQLANEQMLPGGVASRPGVGDEVAIEYEISSMPVSDIIEMVSALLTKITATNDRHHQPLHECLPPPEGAAGLSPQTSSVLAFHGKNIPTITVLSYLTRIHRYCPTTYEVFLGLLVYFDRMTERLNLGSTPGVRPPERRLSKRSGEDGPSSVLDLDISTSPPLSRSSATGPVLQSWSMAASAPDPAFHPSATERLPHEPGHALRLDLAGLSHFFVVDNYNIHRLVIAGVTCASKFFSDVFYTNSRYAKVGGLPLAELNHLEIQFLILNDFRLFVPVEELEAYGTMLVEFYLRDVVALQSSSPMSRHGSEFASSGAMPHTITPP